MVGTVVLTWFTWFRWAIDWFLWAWLRIPPWLKLLLAPYISTLPCCVKLWGRFKFWLNYWFFLLFSLMILRCLSTSSGLIIWLWLWWFPRLFWGRLWVIPWFILELGPLPLLNSPLVIFELMFGAVSLIMGVILLMFILPIPKVLLFICSLCAMLFSLWKLNWELLFDRVFSWWLPLMLLYSFLGLGDLLWFPFGLFGLFLGLGGRLPYGLWCSLSFGLELLDPLLLLMIK